MPHHMVQSSGVCVRHVACGLLCTGIRLGCRGWWSIVSQYILSCKSACAAGNSDLVCTTFHKLLCLSLQHRDALERGVLICTQ